MQLGEAGVEARPEIVLAHERGTLTLHADALDLCRLDAAAGELGAEQRGRAEVVDVDRFHCRTDPRESQQER